MCDFLHSQNPNNQDCLGAIPVCQNIYTQNNSYNGQGNYPNEITSGCLDNGELNDVWYTVNVVSSGNLNFLVSPNNSDDDYDWAVYNLSNHECSEINSPGVLVSCNYSGTTGNTGPNGGTTNTSAGPFDSPFNSTIPVVEGETYAINISNWSSTQNGYTLNFSNSTASIFDNTPPVLDNFTSTPVCGNNTLSINFSENILCSSFTTGDLTLTGPNGAINITDINSPDCDAGASYSDNFTISLAESFQTSGTYTLTFSGGVNDLCGNTSNIPLNYDFEIDGIELSVDTISADCSLGNGEATINATEGSGNYFYEWSHNPLMNGSSSNILFAGNYTVEVNDENGCISEIDFTIENNQSLDISISNSDSISCNGFDDGSASVQIDVGVGPFEYLWSDGQNTPTASDLAPGIYNITVTSAENCVESTSIEIFEPEPLTVNANNDTLICFGDPIILSAQAQGGTPTYIYNWNQGLGIGQNHSITPAFNTTYSVFVIDENGCQSVTENINVSLNTALDVDISTNDTTICYGESVILTATGSGGNNGPYTYTWDPGGIVGQSISVSPSSSTEFSVVISDGCNSIPDIDKTEVNIYDLPEVDFVTTDTAGCPELVSNIYFKGDAGSIVSYDWLINNDFYDTTSFITTSFNSPGCYEVELTVTDTNGCINNYSENCFIEVYPVPDNQFTHLPDTATILNPYFTFIDQTEGAVSWQWDFGDGSTSITTNPFHVYQDTGVYTVQLITTNNYGCIDTTYKNVRVDYLFNLYIPNSFSPNDDGFNDLFFAKGDGFEMDSYELFIFDRWGELIFTSDDINYGWDGRYKKKTLPQGVYSYRIDLIDYEGKPRKILGIVTLIR